jgi:large subunit ribosomal protein L18
MISKVDKNAVRQIRHARVRKKISGTTERPRLNVYRSTNNISVQIIDDTKGHTLLSASTLDSELKEAVAGKTKKEAARIVGETVAKKAIEQGITEIVFDRGGYVYHGRVMELANGARDAGLKF